MLRSGDGRYTLTRQASDGNLVLNHAGVGTIWSLGARDDDWVVNQDDGNLVVYRSDGLPLWASNTDGNGASVLILQNDGNLVLYRQRDGVPIWASGTNGR